ncbi:MAG: hypothetical protein DME47_04555 [Verrucomicrobia bacterium]|nr:MAG: hypothetical protein DME47_04555 [Verrucomicrobiota bacterium]
MRRLVCLNVTVTALLIISNTSRAQTFAPPKLSFTGREQAAKKDPIQVITREAPEVITKEIPPQVIAKEKPAVAMKQTPEVITNPPVAKNQIAEVITKPAPPVAKKQVAADRHLDPKLSRAATIAQERAHAHSRSMCWHYVKEALLASGVIDSRPKSEYARDAAQDLVSNYGFKKLSVRDPFAAPIGSVLVYGTSRSIGHVEIRTKEGFVSDFRSPTPSHRPLIGVYAKL